MFDPGSLLARAWHMAQEPPVNNARVAISSSNVGIVIPTLNAQSHLPKLFEGLAKQPIDRSQILFIDSASTDNTQKLCKAFGARVTAIPRCEFNHGGTRARAIDMMPHARAVIMMTHDAIPVDEHMMPNIIRAFADQSVGMAYGRQLPRPEATGIERFARLYNYPATSEVRSRRDAATLGAKTTFCSNSFAAYRRTAYDQVGGFPLDSFFAEDQVTAGHMLVAGWKLAYCADAMVYHSHAYSMKEEFRRYFDVGVFHARNDWLRREFGAAEGEGLRFLVAEMKYLARNAPLSILSAMTRTGTKYLGYRLGRCERHLSRTVKSKLSMQPFYWKNANRDSA